MSASQATRLRLLRAAERLFAERGVDNVSLREIAAEAQHGNHSAALYHFGTKRELLENLLERHSGPIDAGFPAALDKLREEGKESLRSILGVLVRPMVGVLDDDDGGVHYAHIAAELVQSRTFPLTSLRAAHGAGSQVLQQRLFPFIGGIPPMKLPLRMIMFTSLLFESIANYQRLSSSGLFIPREEFCEDLIEVLATYLSCNLSPAAR